MLTIPYPVPANSTSPLPSDWGQRNAQFSLDMFSAGLTVEPQVACAPGPSAFADLAPAGTLYPVVTANPTLPGLSTAALAPAPVSPLAAQVYQVQQAMRQGLTSGPASNLTDAVQEAGQEGATTSPADWPDAAEVFPMSPTTGIVIERTPIALRKRSKRLPSADIPGVAWGGVPVRVPGGGCSQGLSPWAKLFLLAGAGVILYSAFGE